MTDLFTEYEMKRWTIIKVYREHFSNDLMIDYLIYRGKHRDRKNNYTI